MFTGLSPRNSEPSRSIVTTSRCSVISRTVRVLGTATSMPDCSTGAVIMKITSSTSTTSTSGVILMSASELCVRPLLLVKATLYLVRQIAGRQFAALDRRPRRSRRTRSRRRTHMNFLQRIQQLAAEVIDRRSKDLYSRRELVVRQTWGPAQKNPPRCRDQGFRDPGRHRAKCRRPRGSQAVKRIHHAHHRSEQPHERTGGRNRRQPCQPPFEC